MKLDKLMEGIKYQVLQGELDKEIVKFEYDSRKIKPNNLFVCITGFQTDGHKYAKQAVEDGAIAIICERMPEGIPKDVTVLQVENARAALALAAANFYDHPSEKMNIIGVTGTNGKTTTTYLIRSILTRIGHKVGVIGTIENRIGDKVIPTGRTTPESLELQELFDEMHYEKVDDVVMEVSSHALDLHRVDGCHFHIGIFTNLTQDHLDYHKTMENYKKAKGILFQRCDQSVINMDDEAGAYMCQISKGPVLTYGIDNKADLQAENIHISAHGVQYTLDYQQKQYQVTLNIPGKFSIYNSLSAIGACLLMHVPMEDIIEGLKENQGVPGRFQTVASENGLHAIVDYAHTPDGLENILNTAHEFVTGKIITVFGCGGDRDKTKRPIMGEIAGNLSDFCVITSDNPRTENPDAILDDIEVGMLRTTCPYIKIVDRREAIDYAVKMASSGDVVVVAGKGHENYQIFANETIHFDDVEVVKEVFQQISKEV